MASWLASVASASAAADTEVLRLRASRSASSIGSFSSASPRRQTAIYRFGSSALLPKGVDGPEIASIDARENQQAEDEAVDAVDTVEKSLPAGTMILLGLASLIFPMIVYICPRLRKSDTIPLHQGYAAVPRSEVIGHGADFPHGAPLTNSTIHLPPAESAQGTQFFYIGEENATDATENADADEPQAMVGYTSALEAPPTESEPEAELCPESNVPSPSHTAQVNQITVPAAVTLPKLAQPIPQSSHSVHSSVLPEAFQPEDAKGSTRSRMLMLYASPLCRTDARGPAPLPALCFEKEWKTVLKASAEAHCGPTAFAARALTSGVPVTAVCFQSGALSCAECARLPAYLWTATLLILLIHSSRT